MTPPPALELGPLRISPPVVLAPMAGITNYPFRRICRSFGAGLYVSEMILARPLLAGDARTLRLADFGPDETPRSLQLYGVDPTVVGEAVARLVGEGRVDHIDMNFGCPVPKVTRRGGGAAIPAKPQLLGRLVRAAVASAGDVPVTIKFRLGLWDELLTYRQSGHVAQEEGCAAVGLHARTAAQLYAGDAHWPAIADLVSRISIPVLGNGDIWEAKDAMAMMTQTGCHGVIVGRGCLGRPWIFRDLDAALAGRPVPGPPVLGEVADVLESHAAALADWMGEMKALRSFRKHIGWYLAPFPRARVHLPSFMQVDTLDALRALLVSLDHDEHFNPAEARVPRGKAKGPQRVALPHRYLEHLDDDVPPEAAAAQLVSGG